MTSTSGETLSTALVVLHGDPVVTITLLTRMKTLGGGCGGCSGGGGGGG